MGGPYVGVGRYPQAELKLPRGGLGLVATTCLWQQQQGDWFLSLAHNEVVAVHVRCLHAVACCCCMLLLHAVVACC